MAGTSDCAGQVELTPEIEMRCNYKEIGPEKKL